jgi:hypothetical protein
MFLKTAELKRRKQTFPILGCDGRGLTIILTALKVY